MECEQNEQSDEELMMSYGDGNADAFEILYQRYKTPLYRFVQRQCYKQTVDELFQDIWLKVINARNSYQVTASFKTWLYHMARNRIIDQYRKNNIRIIDNNIDDIDTVENTSIAQPEKQLHTQTQYQTLLEAISELPPDQKEAFLLREEAGLNIEQIAETCGINAETAKSRLRYAIKKLRKKIGDSDYA
ncbi:MAG: sigma-70 family RNA polymerase sigma factor [Gammaproteobacteria bacterium]|nr:sigma-70 family RNA polymerase sigma factor [Gammaproteobacteria bacterium]